MIDYFLKFADEATALAALQQFTNRTDWPLDYCIPGIQLWRVSQDVAGVHTFLPGFFVLVSLRNLVPALRDLAAVQVVIDRDKGNAGQVGAVVKSNVSNLILQDIRIAPVFAGINLPYGAFQ